MTGPYPLPQIARPPAVRAPFAWLPGALIGVIALVGLLATLLPVWVVDVDSNFARGYDFDDEYRGTVEVAFNFYSWVAAGVPAIGLIPLALAAAVAVAVLQLVRGVDRGMWGGIAALMTVTAVLAGSAALQPAPKTEITGDLANQMRPEDLQRVTGTSMDVPISYGAGLIIAMICVLAVLGVAAWQYLARASRPAAAWPRG